MIMGADCEMSKITFLHDDKMLSKNGGRSRSFRLILIRIEKMERAD